MAVAARVPATAVVALNLDIALIVFASMDRSLRLWRGYVVTRLCYGNLYGVKSRRQFGRRGPWQWRWRRCAKGAGGWVRPCCQFREEHAVTAVVVAHELVHSSCFLVGAGGQFVDLLELLPQCLHTIILGQSALEYMAGPYTGWRMFGGGLHAAVHSGIGHDVWNCSRELGRSEQPRVMVSWSFSRSIVSRCLEPRAPMDGIA